MGVDTIEETPRTFFGSLDGLEGGYSVEVDTIGETPRTFFVGRLAGLERGGQHGLHDHRHAQQ
eukprot:5795884-Pyramimonas_sp.AAC.1